MSRAYWLDLFTGTTWAEFLASGATVTGFRAKRKPWAKKIKPGDYFICYLTGVSRFVGLLEVTSDLFESDEQIWKDEPFPVRFKVQMVATLKPETAVPAHGILTQFSWYKPGVEKGAWGAYFLGSPAPLNVVDGEMLTSEVLAALKNPVERPLDQKKLANRPGAGRPHHKKDASPVPAAVPIATKADVAAADVVPTADMTPDEPAATSVLPEPDPDEEAGSPQEATAHTEIEALLLRIGSAMGLELWIDPSDRGKSHNGSKLGSVPGVIDDLPLPFTPDVMKTIRRIDVLWLKDQMVVGAFEVESTTSIYSGLLRMSDLVAMNPNLTIPMFIVAPEARRDRVRQEIGRPTFAKLFKPRMAKRCRYIPFDRLRERFALLEQAGALGALAPEAFLAIVAEIAEPE